MAERKPAVASSATESSLDTRLGVTERMSALEVSYAYYKLLVQMSLSKTHAAYPK
jgi:hypothetical protein